jgi:hypothetical protein
LTNVAVNRYFVRTIDLYGEQCNAMHKNTAEAVPRRGLIPAAQMPDLYGNSPSWWAKARVYGTGPAYVKIGKSVYHEPSAVEAWLDRQRRMSTSDEGEA